MTRQGVPLWARVLGVLLALQVVVLVGAAGVAGTVWLGGADRYRHSTETLPPRPALALDLVGFGGVNCGFVRPGHPPCLRSASTRGVITTDLRVQPGKPGAIVVDDDAGVRAAGPALADRYLGDAAIHASTTQQAVTLSVGGWSRWDLRLLRAWQHVTILVPPDVRVATPVGPPANPGNLPNAPNAPNVPNTPNGASGRPIDVAAGTRWAGEASAWNADVTVEGEVPGDVNVVGGSATITGTVDGNVNVWDGTAVITGHVLRQVSVSGGAVTIQPQGTVGGEVLAWRTTGPVSIRGRVGGPVSVVMGSLTLAEGGHVGRGVMVWTPDGPVHIDGTVGGDAGVSRGSIVFGARSSLGGRVRVWNGSCAGPPCDTGR